MYKTSDYLRNGVLYLNNIIRPHHKRLSTLMIYSTTKCQSRCKHCSIWQKPEEHLSLRMIKMIMASQCVTKNTVVGLEGGEFLLHPEANAIMEWFKDNHPNYTLLSNCLAPQKVIEAVRLYHPSHLYVSLDGNKETYKAMRGCNGHDKVLEVIETLKDEVPVSLMFCLSPWNTFEDMDYVIGLAKRYDVDVRLRLRCQSIFSELVIHSNGDVPLCQNLGVMLGNVYEHSLDEIFNSREATKVQCQYSRECNGCWINFHRKYDIILLRNLEKVFPKSIIEVFYGKYQWTGNRAETYRKYIKKIGF